MGISGATLADLLWPTLSQSITDYFGWRTHPITGEQQYHSGIDIGAGMGESVMAAGMGEVIFAGDGGGYGNMVKIDHGDGLITAYAHLSSILASVGDLVDAGDIIGLVGSTGNSTGPHLHFEILQDGVPIDPLQIKGGYASGTNYATAGFHWVGEKGPELVKFKGGESVLDAEESASLASGITQNVYITSPTPLSPSKIAKETKRAMQELAWDM
ncbi:peptidoglycan DD-metalloendopeptidase family protein [Acetobacterium wieringae]